MNDFLLPKPTNIKIRTAQSVNYIDGLFYEDGIPFTGVFLEFTDGLLVSAISVRNGNMMGQFTGLLQSDSCATRVDSNFLQLDEFDRLRLNGVPYSGFAYSISAGKCESEHEYQDGEEVSIRCWDQFGRIEMEERTVLDWSYSLTWHANSQLRSLNISGILLMFDEYGRVTMIHLISPLPDQPILAEELPIFLKSLTLSSVCGLCFSDHVEFRGLGIESNLFVELMDRSSLVDVSKIRISNTMVDDSVLIRMLYELPSLLCLELEFNNRIHGEFLDYINANRRDIRLHFEGKWIQ